jgi:hypothetical protein
VAAHRPSETAPQAPGIRLSLTRDAVVSAVGLRSSAVLSGLAVLCVAGCGQGSVQSDSCVSVPQMFRQDRLVASGATIHVPVGAVLWVALVESAEYSASRYPTSFPWLTPTSSNQDVISPVRLCPRRSMYSLPVRIAGFRAVGDGDAILLAKLAPRWRGRTRAVQNYRATVIVGH